MANLATSIKFNATGIDMDTRGVFTLKTLSNASINSPNLSITGTVASASLTSQINSAVASETARATAQEGIIAGQASAASALATGAAAAAATAVATAAAALLASGPGPKGDPGSNGDNGKDGKDGSDGGKGDTGPRGSAGEDAKISVSDSDTDALFYPIYVDSTSGSTSTLSVSAGVNNFSINPYTGAFNFKNTLKIKPIGFDSIPTDPPTQQSCAICIGSDSGSINQGLGAIAIGFKAGETDQHSNSICLNASTTALNSIGSGFFVNPIRLDDTSSNICYYNSTSKEITYGALLKIVDNDTNGVFYPVFTSSTGAVSSLYIDQTFSPFSINPFTGDINLAKTLKITNLYGKVGIGLEAANVFQEVHSVAIGTYAGNSQGAYCIAIGYEAGYNQIAVAHAYEKDCIAIGHSAGKYQGQKCIAIGSYAGMGTGLTFPNYQGNYAIAIGSNSGKTIQGGSALAIGVNAAENNQGYGCVAVGVNAGRESQGQQAIAIGLQSGLNNQGSSAISIGTNSGLFKQGLQAIAIGQNAGIGYPDESTNFQGSYAIAIGSESGSYTQGERAVAIGIGAGRTSQGNFSVAIGNGAGIYQQSSSCIAIGSSAGSGDPNTEGSGQKTSAVAIGVNAGRESQGQQAIAIGLQSGLNNQGSSAISIGTNSGLFKQGLQAIAIGQNAGVGSTFESTNFQGSYAIAIGSNSGSYTQGERAVAIGNGAGSLNQGINSIAIGENAGYSNQAANSIILNASNTQFTSSNSGFFVKPVRNDATPTNICYFNSTTNEITYGIKTPPSFSIVTVSKNDFTSSDANFYSISTITIPALTQVMITLSASFTAGDANQAVTHHGFFVSESSTTSTNISFAAPGLVYFNDHDQTHDANNLFQVASLSGIITNLASTSIDKYVKVGVEQQFNTTGPSVSVQYLVTKLAQL